MKDKKHLDAHKIIFQISTNINPLNAELNPICHLLALLGAHHIFHVSELRVNIHRNCETQTHFIIFSVLINLF